MELQKQNEAWVTFCMTTYKRPGFLRNQLTSLFLQTDPNFYVVISDNDPEASARSVVEQFNDDRLFYYHNVENLGMIKSFNRSIQNAHTTYLVMLTDDDHVDTNMLLEFHEITVKYPGYPIYIGCERLNKPKKQVEMFNDQDYIFQLLNPLLTKNLLWSSCLLETSTVQKLGGIPDFGSPHFADHALLILCGKDKGGIFINNLYGSLNSHDQNFSKSQFDLYYRGCIGFYEFIKSNVDMKFYKKKNVNALENHLHTWFFRNYFSLKKYFTFKNYQHQTLEEIETFSKKILRLSFMKSMLVKFRIMQFLFFIKRPIFLIRYHR